MKRLFIVLIKYIPIIQMVGMLFNNILYCFSDIYIISYILDFIRGTIKINIPSFDKQLVFDYNDIETFKQNILN